MNRQWLTVGIVAVVVLVAAGALYTVLQTDRSGDAGAPAITGAERAEEARVIIEELRESAAEEPARGAAAPGATARVDYDEAFAQAQEFQRAGQLADAQLLYFFAARGNHAPSAFALGTMNDPNHHSPETSLLPEPDAFQAYRWYSVASTQGMAEATPRLAALREWATKAAANGDAEAERLLLQWE